MSMTEAIAVEGAAPVVISQPKPVRAFKCPRFLSAFAVHIGLVVAATLMILPFVWMVLTSLKTAPETEMSKWFPSTAQWHNYKDIFVAQGVDFGRWYVNSIFIAAWTTFLQLFTSATAAFAFARLRWPGRDKIFFLYLMTMMIPGLVLIIPNYQIMIDLHLVDSYLGLILPGACSVFGTFMLR